MIIISFGFFGFFIHLGSVRLCLSFFLSVFSKYYLLFFCFFLFRSLVFFALWFFRFISFFRFFALSLFCSQSVSYRPLTQSPSLFLSQNFCFLQSFNEATTRFSLISPSFFEIALITIRLFLNKPFCKNGQPICNYVFKKRMIAKRWVLQKILEKSFRKYSRNALKIQ